jgi:predicted permease
MRWKHWRFTAPLRFRSIFRRWRVEQELDEELRFHLESKIEEGLAHGLSEEEARYRAMRAMDGMEQRKEEARDMRRIHWITDFIDDSKYALRSLRQAPGLAAFVVITLALGIGMNSAIFSLVDAMILRPMPVAHPGGIVDLVSSSREYAYDNFSYREYLDVRDRAKSYEGIVAASDMQGVGFSAEPGAAPRVKGGMLVSANYFRVLGVEPAIGRGFREDEDRVPGRDAVVVLGPGFWKQDFASDAGVVGRHVLLNGLNFTVIGVAPEKFTGTGIYEHPDFYVPLAMTQRLAASTKVNFFEDRDDRALNLRGRLKPGVTVEQARGEIAVLAKDWEREYPKFNKARGASVYSELELRTKKDDGDSKLSLLLAVLALAVLLVACTNVAGLLLSRARTRTREIAVRLAIGAGRFRLIRLMLTESLMLTLLGGMAGIAIGYGGVKFLGTYKVPSELPITFTVQMDRRALLFSLAVTLLSAILCGLVPALQSTRMNLVTGLKAADVDVPGRRRTWGRSVLVVAQVSTSLMLLTAAFLTVRSFERVWSEGSGLSKEHLLMATFDPRLVRYSDSQIDHFYRNLVDRVRAEPGVINATVSANYPMAEGGFEYVSFVPDGFKMPHDGESFGSLSNSVDEFYFAATNLPLLRGRGFQATDTADTPRVAVVNEHFAKHYWPGSDALGKRIRLAEGKDKGVEVEIVGVAPVIKYQWFAEPPTDFVYLPRTQHPEPQMTLLLRANGDPRQLTGALRKVVQSLDANQPMFDVRTYESFYHNRVEEAPQMIIDLVSAMGLVGLVLTIAGLYGLIAYNVNRRTREIGIRMAIGAGRWDVLRMVMKQGLVLVGIGTLLGLAMGFGAERLLNSLFETSRVDFVAYLVVVPMLLTVTMLAAYVPARRASRIEPTRALRYE